MYIPRLTLPAVSNREDLLLTVSLFDDDTGPPQVPIKLDGCYVNGNQPYTGSSWTVTDGAIVTSSATAFTIPVFPIGGTLSQLTIAVGAALGINAGDPIVISDTPTGKNYVTGYVTSYAMGTGVLVVQVGATFQFEIRRWNRGVYNTGSGYIPWYDWGTPGDVGALLTASLGNGITHIDVGVLQVWLAETSMRQLGAHTYGAAMTVSDSVNTRQLFIAELPVNYGGVTQ